MISEKKASAQILLALHVENDLTASGLSTNELTGKEERDIYHELADRSFLARSALRRLDMDTAGRSGILRRLAVASSGGHPLANYYSDLCSPFLSLEAG